MKAYAELALPAVESFGGRFLTRSLSKVQPHEAGLQQRTVVVEFESYEVALAAYESEGYKKALKALGSGAEQTSHRGRRVAARWCPFKLCLHFHLPG